MVNIGEALLDHQVQFQPITTVPTDHILQYHIHPFLHHVIMLLDRVKIRAMGCMQMPAFLKRGYQPHFLCCIFLNDNLVFIVCLYSFHQQNTCAHTGEQPALLGGAQHGPYLENIFHALVDELHVDNVQQGGCWQHLAPKTHQ